MLDRVRRAEAALAFAAIATCSSIAMAASWGDPAPNDRAPPPSWGSTTARPSAIPPGAGVGPSAPIAAPSFDPPRVSPSADGVLVSDLTLSFGSVVYRIPRLELRGTSLSAPEVSAVFAPSSGEPAAIRIARLSAAEILVPVIAAESTATGARQVTTYRDVVFSGVKDGRIGSMTASGGAFEETQPRGGSRGTFARLSASDVDLGLAVTLYNGVAAGATEDPKRLYGAVSLDGIALTDAAGASVRIDHLGSGEVLARPTRTGIRSLAAPSETLSGARPGSLPDSFAILADLVDSVEIRSLEATGFAFDDTQAPSKGRIARFAFLGAQTGRPSEIRIEGVEVGSDAGHMRLGSAAVTGLSLGPLIDKARARAGGQNLGEAGLLRDLVPATGLLHVSDLAFEGGPATPAGARTGFTIGAIEVAAARPVGDLPSEMTMQVRDLGVPIEAGGDQEGLAALADLGYRRLDASVGLEAGWNEAAQEVLLREFSLDAPALGRVTLSGVLGNVSRDVFSSDATLAMVAFAGASARSLDISVENRGLYERILERQAKRQRRPVEDVRRDYALAAAVGIPAMLGNSSAAKTLGAAMARFAARPGRLAIQVKAKNAGGFGIADLTANPDPGAILGLLDITATAQ